MKTMIWRLAAVLFLFTCFLVPVLAEETQFSDTRTVNINEDWQFQLNGGEVQNVNLPHDWSITQEFSTECEAESGFLPGGKGIYRKSLVLPETWKDRRILIRFGGVYMNAEVFVNGRKLGEHPYGYSEFCFDLSKDLIRDGKTENLIEVRVNNEQPNSRWYSGSGIYRDVDLIITEERYIEENGIRIITPDTADGLTVIETTVGNDTDETCALNLRTEILDAEGNVVNSDETELQVSAGKNKQITQKIAVDHPDLWSTEHPVRYTCRSELLATDGRVIDAVDTAFGYRTVVFDAEKGMFLNGEPVKLKGVCLHHDQGPLGAAAEKKAIDRQLDLLQEMGINAIRTAHNPADSHLLAECSRRGILVVEEAFDTWLIPKNGNDYDYSRYFLEPVTEDNELMNAEAGLYWSAYDARQMVLHSRNEPCVIMYSIGNEILGNIEGDTSQYPEYAAKLSEWISRYDSRPVTIADNMTTKENPIQIGMDTAVAEAGGVVGLNYATGASMDKYHSEHPDWALYGSETVSVYGSRGEYKADGIDEKAHSVTAFDEATVEWGMRAEQAWLETIQRDWIAGEFVWTGFDYIGEPEPWNGIAPGSVTDGSPAPRSSYFGIFDTAGLPKDAFWFYQSQWRDDLNVVHILPDWNPNNIRKDFFGRVKAAVYTNAPSVELFLNGVSLGRVDSTVHTTEMGYSYRMYGNGLYPTWKVKYTAGTLEAVAYDEAGNVIKSQSGRNRVSTSFAASRIAAECARTVMDADETDLLYVTVRLVDRYGNEVSDEDTLINAQIEGNGFLAASDNGNPNDLTGFQSGTEEEKSRMTYHGKAVFVVQSSGEAGEIVLRLSSEGFPETVLRMETGTDNSTGTLLQRLAQRIQREKENTER